ncbi:C2H2-type domain-containing protein, partial [Durusdinium trenchii]
VALHALFLKCWVLQWKGGFLVPIWKQKGAVDDPTSYRGIALLDVVAKRWHAFLRTLTSRRNAASMDNLEGFPGSRRIAGLPDAAPFVDIKGAFHYLARELALRMSIPLPEVLKHVLTVENIDPALLAAHLGDAPELNGWIIPYLFDVLFKMPTPSPGKDAPAFRDQYYVQEQGLLLSAGDGLPAEKLKLAVRYKYLGAQTSQHGGFLPEINMRLASAACAYRELRKPIFANKTISVPTRLRLLEALVLTRLFFNSGFWPQLPPRCLRKIAHVVLRWQRNIVQPGNAKPLDSDWHFQRALPTSGTPSRLLPMESPQRGYDKFIVALRDKPNYVRTLVHRWLWQEKAVVEAYDGHQVIQTLFSSAGYVFKDQTLLGGPLQDVGGMFTCPFCPHRFQHRQSLQAHLWRKHQETSLERKYVTGPVCKACGKCFWTPQRAQQHLSRSRLHGTACFRTLFEHETPLNEPARFQPPERLIGVCRLPAVQTQSPAQWETSAWQRAQADALQDWQNRWQALDLPDTLPPEWYEQCEDQLDRVTSCWLTLPPDQRFDISDAWLMVLSSLEARHARHCQPLRSPPLRGQYYDQVQLWQPFTLRIDHSPRLPFTPVVVTPLGEKLIYAMHFFSGRRRVGDCHTFFQQEALPPGYGFVLLSLDTMAIWMAPTGLCWWSSWGLALVHLASLAHHVKLSLQHGTCRLQMACAVLHDHFGQRKRFGVSLIA